jgi:hypothetical protein
MTHLLINKNDFKEYKALSKGRSIDIIEQYILEAQDLDLKDIICREFFFDILKNNQLPVYQKLIHGETYTDAAGNDIEFKGLKAVLAYFAYARYIMTGHITDTPFGMVQKTNDNSTAITSTEKRDVRDRCRIDAMTYWKECEIYLKEKIADFPKWKDCAECGGSAGTNSRTLKHSVL